MMEVIVDTSHLQPSTTPDVLLDGDDPCDASKKCRRKTRGGGRIGSSTFTDAEQVQFMSQRMHNCLLCGKSFSDRTHLDRHMRTHSKERPHICSYCHKTFIQRAHLTQHVYTHTREKNHICCHCHKSFVQKTHLNAHLLTHTKEKPYVCTYCDKRFTQKSHLKGHLLTHTRERQFPCTQCDKAFIQKPHLKQHLLTHTNQRKFVCPEDGCGKAFIQKTHLNNHHLTHTKEKPFVCDVCEKGFTQKSHLTGHRRIHSHERPHKCHMCDKSFVQSGHLVNHLKNVHGLQADHRNLDILCSDTQPSCPSVNLGEAEVQQAENLQPIVVKPPNMLFSLRDGKLSLTSTQGAEDAADNSDEVDSDEEEKIPSSPTASAASGLGRSRRKPKITYKHVYSGEEPCESSGKVRGRERARVTNRDICNEDREETDAAVNQLQQCEPFAHPASQQLSVQEQQQPLPLSQQQLHQPSSHEPQQHLPIPTSLHESGKLIERKVPAESDAPTDILSNPFSPSMFDMMPEGGSTTAMVVSFQDGGSQSNAEHVLSHYVHPSSVIQNALSSMEVHPQSQTNSSEDIPQSTGQSGIPSESKTHLTLPVIQVKHSTTIPNRQSKRDSTVTMQQSKLNTTTPDHLEKVTLLPPPQAQSHATSLQQPSFSSPPLPPPRTVSAAMMGTMFGAAYSQTPAFGSPHTQLHAAMGNAWLPPSYLSAAGPTGPTQPGTFNHWYYSGAAAAGAAAGCQHIPSASKCAPAQDGRQS